MREKKNHNAYLAETVHILLVSVSVQLLSQCENCTQLSDVLVTSRSSLENYQEYNKTQTDGQNYQPQKDLVLLALASCVCVCICVCACVCVCVCARERERDREREMFSGPMSLSLCASVSLSFPQQPYLLSTLSLFTSLLPSLAVLLD